MKVAVFSCNGRERVYFNRTNIENFKFRFFSKDLNIDTIALAEGFNTVIICTSDCLTPLVLQQLHRLQIKYIIFYNKGEKEIPVEKVKAFNMKIAYIPARQEAITSQEEPVKTAAAGQTLDATQLTLPFSVSRISSSSTATSLSGFTNEVGILALETITGWKKGRKSRFELDITAPTPHE